MADPKSQFLTDIEHELAAPDSRHETIMSLTALDLSTIAAGLSEAQKRAILACDEHVWRNAKEIGASGSTLRSLCWFWPKGSNPIGPCLSLIARDYEDAPLRYIYRLTPLGLALRAHLQEHKS